jgi:hypothetical protein
LADELRSFACFRIIGHNANLGYRKIKKFDKQLPVNSYHHDFLNIEHQDFIQKIGSRFHEIIQTQKQHGIFLNDRETVSCAQCGLTEDIAFNGKLYTYYKDDPEANDTGLLFITLDNDAECLECPVCKTEVLIPIENEFEH